MRTSSPCGNLDRSAGRFSDSEKVKLLAIARRRPEWQNARLAALLALNTTMRGCEVKNLRWSDVDLLDRVITICTSKTEAGERTIPIDAEAWSAIGELRERAQLFGGTELRKFLFPASEHGRVDPTRPIKSWRSAWQQLTKAAGIKPPLPLSSSTCEYRSGGIAAIERSDNHEHCWSRISEDATAILPRSDGSEATSLESFVQMGRKPRLRHKGRHK